MAVLLVGKFCHQTLSSKSGILWIYGAFKTTGNSEKTRVNHDVRDIQVGALEKGSRKRPEFPTWNSELDDRSKCVFPVEANFFQSAHLS
jgi:hypothetical protein